MLDCENNNTISLALGENILFKERNDTSNLEVENAIESCEVDKIANESLQILLVKVMNKMDKEKDQMKRKHDEKVHDANTRNIHLKPQCVLRKARSNH